MVPRADGLYPCEACGRGFETPHGVMIHKNTCNGIPTVTDAVARFGPPPQRRSADNLFECEDCKRGFETTHGSHAGARTRGSLRLQCTRTRARAHTHAHACARAHTCFTHVYICSAIASRAPLRMHALHARTRVLPLYQRML